MRPLHEINRLLEEIVADTTPAVAAPFTNADCAYASGYCIAPHRHAISHDPPAHVVLHKLGTSERGYLTPAEARRVAALLVAAANNAEGNS